MSHVYDITRRCNAWCEIVGFVIACTLHADMLAPEVVEINGCELPTESTPRLAKSCARQRRRRRFTGGVRAEDERKLLTLFGMTRNYCSMRTKKQKREIKHQNMRACNPKTRE